MVIDFDDEITDLSFVYHQIETLPNPPTEFRAILDGSIVETFSNTSIQSQYNNYFGFTDILFDRLELDYESQFNVDSLAYNLAASSEAPIPATFGLFGLGLAGLGWSRRKKA